MLEWAWSIHLGVICMRSPARRVSRQPLAIAVALALGLGSAHAASITVTDGGDAGTAATCTLRQAVESANTDAAVGNCTAGSGADTIDFAAGLAGSTITLAGTQLEVDEDLVINGSGQTIDADGNSRVIRVADYTSLTASNLIITGGNSGSYGGGISAGYYSSLKLSNCTVTGNHADWDGGGIYLDEFASLELTNSIISNNTANDDGGGIYGYAYNPMTILGSTISGNQSDDEGGGLYAWEGDVSLSNSTISGNQAYYGGGLYIRHGDTSLVGSTISGNQANYEGGGILAGGDAEVAITNSTISDNQTGYYGGGIFAGTYSDLTINNSTITGNSAGNGGGIAASAYDYYGTIYQPDILMQNTILTGNTATGSNPDLGRSGGGGPPVRPAKRDQRATAPGKAGPVGSTIDIHASLLGTALQADYTGDGNIFTDAPGLGPLANNGGPTLTHLPQTGSPAINAGNNGLIPAGISFDQRGAGFPRIVAGTVDIGAVEAAAAPPPAPPPTLVPASSPWSLGLLGGLLGLLGFLGLRSTRGS